MRWIHKYRSPFLAVNGLIILLFAGGALAFPQAFWRGLGLEALDYGLNWLLGWYLLVFGLGALGVSRQPEKAPAVIALVGFEKLGAATVFTTMSFQSVVNVTLLIVGLADAVLALILLRYALWLLYSEGR